MTGIAAASAIGAAIAAAGFGIVSAVNGHPVGLATALQHIPSMAPGGSVVSAVQNAIQNGISGIGSAVSAAAKDIARAFKGL